MAESETKCSAASDVCENCKKEGTRRPPDRWGCYESGHGVMVSLEISAADGHVKCLEALLNAGALVNHVNSENKYTPLMWAARYGHDECVDLLIKAGADVSLGDFHSDNALMLASSYVGNIKSVELLMEAGADVNHGNWQGSTALMYAAGSGHEEIASLLIKAGSDVNAVTKELHGAITAIHCSATSPDGWKCIDTLVKAGADVNFLSGGTTPLMWALVEECIKSVEGLIRAGADVNIVGEEHGLTALHHAVQTDDGLCKMFIEAGADVNVRSPLGYTPLMEAMDDSRYNCVEMLINAGADVNITCNEDLATALFWALNSECSWSKSVECVKLLLRLGARINVRNNKGNTALEETLSTVDLQEEVGETFLTLFAAGETVKEATYPVSFAQDIKVRTQGHRNENVLLGFCCYSVLRVKVSM